MGRSPCCEKNGLKKGPWTPEEDQKLVDYIQKHGYGNWRTLPKNAGLQRCGKSCRLRWTNYLRPDIKRGRFSFEEEETIIQLHSILGNKWSAIAARLPGRTDNEIKNYWNTHIRKRLLRMGIDPVTHSPRLDLLDLTSILGSQMNLSRLLGVQSLVNPELLNLANSFAPSQPNQNLNFLLPNLQENQIFNPQIQDPVQEIQGCVSLDSNSAICNQINLQFVNDGVPSHLCQEYVTLPSCGHYNYNDQPIIDFSSEASKQNSNLASVLSTPSNSSPTQLNSNSTEDERESYCSDLLQFEFPELVVDVNQLLHVMSETN